MSDRESPYDDDYDSKRKRDRSYDEKDRRSSKRSRSRSSRRYRSRSRSRDRRRSYRSRSRSAGRHSRSGRNNYSRDEQPEPSRCLGIFGMSLYTTEHELHHVLSKYGPLEKVQVVKDAKTGRSRGFAFVYYESLEDAKAAKEGCNGIELDGRRIRCDYSITQRAHTPTPGIYMGNPTYSERNRRRSPGYGRRRSPYRRSPYRRSPSYDRDRRRRRDYRSRSRSYSRGRY
ncbi:transformer-2 protein homolog alpha-like [Artemia franciscana]|uniref:transformer-2 protein homolog alpha-like n=1 Tax=Artemia franciscana TaxID=6661 RepID=UPI0032DAFA33